MLQLAYDLMSDLRSLSGNNKAHSRPEGSNQGNDKEESVPCPGQPELAYKGEKFS